MWNEDFGVRPIKSFNNIVILLVGGPNISKYKYLFFFLVISKMVLIHKKAIQQPLELAWWFSVVSLK